MFPSDIVSIILYSFFRSVSSVHKVWRSIFRCASYKFILDKPILNIILRKRLYAVNKLDTTNHDTMNVIHMDISM